MRCPRHHVPCRRDRCRSRRPGAGYGAVGLLGRPAGPAGRRRRRLGRTVHDRARGERLQRVRPDLPTLHRVGGRGLPGYLTRPSSQYYQGPWCATVQGSTVYLWAFARIPQRQVSDAQIANEVNLDVDQMRRDLEAQGYRRVCGNVADDGDVDEGFERDGAAMSIRLVSSGEPQPEQRPPGPPPGPRSLWRCASCWRPAPTAGPSSGRGRAALLTRRPAWWPHRIVRCQRDQ